MNKMVRKLKKSNKALRRIYYLVIIIYIVSFLIFMKNLLSLKGIETFLRIILILFFTIYIFVYAFWNLLNLLQKKYKGLIITSIISLLFIIIFSVGSYYIHFIYNNLNNITEDNKLVYKSYLITMKDTEFNDDSTVGIISKSVESSDNELAVKLYKNKKLSNDTLEYNDYIKLISDLYDQKIDAAFVPGNYVTYFKNEAEFTNIATDTKIIYEYSEEKKMKY